MNYGIVATAMVICALTTPAMADCKNISPQGTWTYGGFGGPCHVEINKKGTFKNADCEIAPGGDVYYTGTGSLRINKDCSALFEIVIRRSSTGEVVDSGTAYGAYVIAGGDLVGATIQWEDFDTTFFQLMRRP